MFMLSRWVSEKKKGESRNEPVLGRIRNEQKGGGYLGARVTDWGGLRAGNTTGKGKESPGNQ